MLNMDKSGLTKVFVYGTLKKNQPNYHVLTSRNAQFVDEALTIEKWPLIIGASTNLPFLLYRKGVGKVGIFSLLILFIISSFEKSLI